MNKKHILLHLSEARNALEKLVREDFHRWRQFPTDMPLLS